MGRLLLLLLAGLAVSPARAQRPDTSGASAADVQRVRQRIGTIRGRRVVRVVQPIVIVGPPPTVGAGPGLAPGTVVMVPTAEGEAPYRVGPGGVLVPVSPLAQTPAPRDSTRLSAPARLETPRLPASPAPLPPARIAPEPVVREVERMLLDVGLLRVVGLHFAFGRADLFEGEDRTLDAVGDVLTRHPELRLSIEGHTDAVSSAAFNQRLSAARAETVRRYLVAQWRIDPARLTAQGFGEAQPVASNSSETGRALNRRVEFRVVE